MIDPLISQVIWSKLQAAVEQMEIALLKVSRSPAFAEAGDFSTAIFEGEGHLVAQSMRNPFLLASTRAMVRRALDYFAFDIQDGDVIVLNDPYHGGVHLQDLTLLMPTFYRDQLVLFPAVQAHTVDLGGVAPGGYHPEAVEIWQEGVRVTPVKLHQGGVRQRDLEKMLVMNGRCEEVFRGDLNAMVAACQVGKRHLFKILDRYGVGAVLQGARSWMDYSEKLIRAELARWEDGEHPAEVCWDPGGEGAREVCIRVSLAKREDRLRADFGGSSPQVENFLNSSLSNTIAHALVPILTAIGREVPLNEGIFRPVEVWVPEGTVVNPAFPAPVGWGPFCVGGQVSRAIGQALERMVPEKVGTVQRSAPLLILAGMEGRRVAYLENLSSLAVGGASGVSTGDGWNAPATLSGMRLPSIEIKELSLPLRFLGREILPDSGGVGRFRGGPGTEVTLCFEESQVTPALIASGEGTGLASPGYQGGKAGGGSSLRVETEAGEPLPPGEPLMLRPLRPGDRVRVRAGGGGGWGDPRCRPPEKVQEDLLDGYVSLQEARREDEVTR